MVKTLCVMVAILFSFKAFAANTVLFYECDGLADVDEYRVGINLTEKKAQFFDNDTTSDLKQTGFMSIDERKVYMFEGNWGGSSDKLLLTFNLPEKMAVLYAIDE